jgi:hypothetical protein
MRNFIFHFAISNWFLSLNLFAKHVQMQQQQEKQITVSIKVKIEKLNNVKEINAKEDADAKSFVFLCLLLSVNLHIGKMIFVRVWTSLEKKPLKSWNGSYVEV